MSEWVTDWLSWVLIKRDNDEPGSIPAFGEACPGRKPPFLLLGASWYCTSHFQLCHEVDRGNWSEPSRWQLWRRRRRGAPAHFFSCVSEALHLLEQSRESCRRRAAAALSMSLLFQGSLCATVPQKHSVPLPRSVCTLIPKRRGSGRNRTKQINNVMSPGRRNFILAETLLL